MRYENRLNKLEALLPKKAEPLTIRDGACWLEVFNKGFEVLQGNWNNPAYWNQANQCFNLSDKLAVNDKNDFCEKYNNDCKLCQQDRGLEYIGSFIASETVNNNDG